jgi:hypothetical protein
MTPDITLTIPVELTRSLIIRRSAAVYGEDGAFDDLEAMKLAIRLHNVVAEYAKIRLAEKRQLVEHDENDPDEPPFPLEEPRGPNALEIADFTMTLYLNTIGGELSPRDGEWISVELVGLGGKDNDDLYLEWLRLCDAITGSDCADSYEALMET